MKIGKLLMATAAVAGCVAGYFGLSPRDAVAQPPAAATPRGVRVAECNICHLSDNEGTQRFSKEFGSSKFINFDSGTIWEKGDGKPLPKSDYVGDPHKYVYKALDVTWVKPSGGPNIAAKMQRLLAGGNPNYKIAEDVRCLGCHGHDTEPGKTDKSLAQFVRDDKDGLGCTGCHGESLTNNDWQYKHYSVDFDDKNKKAVGWRKKTLTEKAAAGQVALRDPAVKATLCASCHVGNAAEGKVVTHDMYAAGHPWLPPFEMGTFLEGQGVHWLTPDKMTGLSELPTGDDVKFFRVKPSEDYFARHVAVGAIVSLKMEMEQLAIGAKAATPGTTLDYARFDCAACHHELRIPSDRQKQGFAGRVPGRIPLKAWTNGLPKAVVAALAANKADEFKKKYDAVTEAATAKPFGDPAKIVTAAGEMSRFCDTLLGVVNVDGDILFVDGDKEKPIKSLIDNCVTRLFETKADPEAAAQLLWALHELHPTAAKRDEFKNRFAEEFKFSYNVREAQVDWLKVFSDAENWSRLGPKKQPGTN